MKQFRKIVVIVILAGLALGYYFYLSNRTGVSEADKVVNTTKIDKILDKDISSVTNTPKSAVKFYSEILECLYNESPSDEQITQLGTKARTVLDEELNNNNPTESYLIELNKDVLEYSKANRIIMSYTVDSTDNVQYYKQDNKEYAVVNATYTLRETDTFTKVNEEYILRKDEEGYWKILGWRVSSNGISDDKNDNE
ncbi:DUF6715 family protein [Candidatus Galacturonibacter soehngenii]|uniref:Uncharacterized protein n=1 Tax=Candidatus Galacturonatibacter soehngenii TaxID=2307010 RepID=A0A7V7QP35_9FIRM|nr:DUF6715 family protein [Candidatus Galacturonibacter soehngenii]KAB1441269.1 hypothetical protein F7O84_00100 [Candidatus Galacturonibacter soehngenii]MBA4688128.1 hypothetical protein [Candidatus Galacturonibacter soehngenii]